MTNQYQLSEQWQDISLTAGNFEISSSSGLPFEISENADKSAPVSAQSLAVKAEGAKTIYARSQGANTITISNCFFADSAVALASGGNSSGGGTASAELTARVNTLETNYTSLNNNALKVNTRMMRPGGNTNIVEMDTQGMNVPTYKFVLKQQGITIFEFGRLYNANCNFLFLANPNNNGSVANYRPTFIVRGFTGGVALESETRVTGNLIVTKNSVSMDVHNKITALESTIADLTTRIQALENANP